MLGFYLVNFRIVTWNVGRLYTPSGNNRLDERDVPLVQRTIFELQPDVMLLQEVVDESQLHRLAHGIGYNGELAQRCGYDRHTAVLVRPPFRPRFSHSTLVPTERGVVTAEFEAHGIQVVASSVHFDILSSARRNAQARALSEIMHSHSDDALVLFGGDFNLDPAWAEGVRELADQETFALLCERHVDLGRRAGPTLLGLLRIDHLFMRTQSPLETEVYVSPRRLPLGDHQPLVCDLRS
jgi:endonuclease/exonuclease/phosphatase family metal-dependent hydrolase